jgi:hypothetical protein
MDTHQDSSHVSQEFMRRLQGRASEMVERGESQITGGKPGEQPLAEWDYAGVGVRHMPEDEQGIIRISIGGGDTPVPLDYCVIRGDIGKCIDLLRRAERALRKAP